MIYDPIKQILIIVIINFKNRKDTKGQLMKKIYMSMVAAAVLSTGAYAESNSIKEAFANGTTSGDISIYTDNVSSDSGDTAYTNTSIGLSYETDSFNGFKAALGMRSNHKLSEKNDADYDETVKAAMHTANISYTADMGALVVGRQAIDLAWISDYHEAVVGVITAVPDTTIILGHTERFMAVDPDAELENMTTIGDDGANVLDVSYEGIANTVINPYFMSAPDLYDAYGIKVTTTISNLDLTAHYAATSEDDATKEDGSIAHLELGTTVSDISLTAGYIMTDKDQGIGSLATLGENIDPFETLGYAYEADTSTMYASVSTDVSTVTLGAFYGVSDSDADGTNSEINVSVSAPITEELAFDAVYAMTSEDNSTNDVNYLWAMLTYSF